MIDPNDRPFIVESYEVCDRVNLRGPLGPYFELFLNLLYNFANYVYTGIKKI